MYNDFHTWTIVWTPIEVSWFLDGKLLKTDNDPDHIPHSQSASELFSWNKMHIVVDQALICPPLDATTFDPLIVDYVKVYRPEDYESYDPSHFTYQEYYDFLDKLYKATPYKKNKDWVSNVIQTERFYPVQVASGLHGLQGGGAFMYKHSSGFLASTYYWLGTNYSIINWNWSVITDNDIALSHDGSLTYYISSNQIVAAEGGYEHFLPNIFDAMTDIVANNTPDDLYYINWYNNLVHYNNGNVTTFGIGTLYGNTASNITPSPVDWKDVYYIGTDNNIWRVNTSSPTNYPYQLTSSYDVTTLLAITKSITADGDMQLYYRSVSGRLRYLYYTSSANSWSKPMDVVAHTWQNAQATTIDNVSRDNNILINPDYTTPQIYFVGTDERPWEVYYDGGEWVCAPIDPDLPNVKGDFNLITYNQDPASPHISYRDINGLIRTIEYKACDVYMTTSDPDHPIILEKTSGYDSTLINKTQENKNIHNYISQSLPNISLAPNPTEDVSYIMLNDVQSADLSKITLSSIDGKEYNIPLNIIRNNQVEVNLINYTPGIYFVTVYSKLGKNILKVVKK